MLPAPPCITSVSIEGLEGLDGLELLECRCVGVLECWPRNWSERLQGGLTNSDVIALECWSVALLKMGGHAAFGDADYDVFLQGRGYLMADNIGVHRKRFMLPIN